MELIPSQYSNDKKYRNNFQKFNANAFRYGFLGLNLLDERFKDKRVRQAISYAIDKEAIIKIVLMGMGKVSTGPYPSVAWYHNDEVKPLEYDPAKATKLLEAAGWKKDNHGVLKRR